MDIGSNISAESLPGLPDQTPARDTQKSHVCPYVDHVNDIMNISLSAIGPYSTGNVASHVADPIELELIIQGGTADPLVSGSYHIQDITHPDIVASRVGTWPAPVSQPGINVDRLCIYDSVRRTGLPNMLSCKIPIHTQLNPIAWEENAVGHVDDDFLIRGVKYGFPLQYIGGPIRVENPPLHSSAKDYLSHIQSYVDNETANLSMMGPFHNKPFDAWFHISPLMTRPKSDPDKRRVIVDLSFPPGKNVNSQIPKNVLFGNLHDHSLPTVQQLVDSVRDRDFKCVLATIDIQRAYINIPVCPLDYPLLGISFRGQYYVDTALPFGARNSSLVMQKLAGFITRALAARGIASYMFLDDLVLILDPDRDPNHDFLTALALFRTLGLPIAYDKIQPPSRAITYLGINIDLVHRELSVPGQKIQDFLALIHQVSHSKYIPIRQFQSIIGKINFFSKIVKPARLFMARALATLRHNYDAQRIPVDNAIKADLRWFRKFLVPYNACTMINSSDPSKTIYADSCLTGAGATDLVSFYTLIYPPRISDAFHITILEALNCLVALRRLLSDADNGSTIRLCCDNLSTVFCLTTGKARDPVLAAIARAVWYIQAHRNIDLIVDHIPGSQMDIADSLSRAHLSESHSQTATKYIQSLQLRRLNAPLYLLDYKPYL